MKFVLATALLLVPAMIVLPAASAADAPDVAICDPLDCLIAPPPRCVYSVYATVCTTVAGGCVEVMADGHRRPVTVGTTVPATDFWTPAVNYGPVHVGSTHVWTDAVPVYYTVYTLDNGVSNEFCYWSAVADVMA